MLLPHLNADRDRCARSSSAGSKCCSMPALACRSTLLDALQRLAVDTAGERIIFLSSLGSTETAPAALACSWESERAGNIGLPMPGVELKLVPRDGKFEARLKGANITPGYWRAPQLTADAFDEDGFYKIGDALKFEDPDDPSKGLLFDGRLAEDFKLATGTWVSVGPLRAAFIAHFAPLVRDVVLAGADRDACRGAGFSRSRRLPRILRPITPPRCLPRWCSPIRAWCASSRGCSIHSPRHQHRHFEPHHPRHVARRTAVARYRRDDRQGLDQPARGARASRAIGRSALCRRRRRLTSSSRTRHQHR